jgi:hypothetical protein
VRANALVPVALIAIAGCAGGHADSDASPSPSVSPDALRSCEIREFSLDGADLVVQANADGTPASIVVVRAPSDDARAKAFQDARKDFGDPSPDPRTEVRQYKDGLTQLTDLCGRPVMPKPQ